MEAEPAVALAAPGPDRGAGDGAENFEARRIEPVNQFVKSVEAEPARFRFERVPQETGADRGDSGVAHQADFLFRCFWCEFGEMGGHAEERNRFHKISCLW